MEEVNDGRSSRPGFFEGVGLGPLGVPLKAAGLLETRSLESEHVGNAGVEALYGSDHAAYVQARCPFCDGTAWYLRGRSGESFRCNACYESTTPSDDEDEEDPREAGWQRDLCEAFVSKLRGSRPVDPDYETYLADLLEIGERDQEPFDWRCAIAAVPGIRQRGGELVIAGPVIERVTRYKLAEIGWSERVARELLGRRDWFEYGVLPLSEDEARKAQGPLAELAELLTRLRKPLSAAVLLAHYTGIIERAFAAMELPPPETTAGLGRVLRVHGPAVGIVQCGRNGDGALWGIKSIAGHKYMNIAANDSLTGVAAE
jgi:hypothetical protein